MEYITLSNGVKMPQLGYGVYQVTKEECERCVLDALEVGYRSIDTAQSYFNEEEVGHAIEKSGIDRKEIFLLQKYGLNILVMKSVKNLFWNNGEIAYRLFRFNVITSTFWRYLWSMEGTGRTL